MKKLFLSLLILALPLLASAYDCQVDGIYYNLIPKGNVAEVTYGDSDHSGSVTIPEKFTYEGVEYSVTSIGYGAFIYDSGLTSVTIPNSVTSIGERAFFFCSSLTSVTIPNSVTSIEQEAFFYCSSLTSVTIPNSVTSIGYYAFSGCSGLTSVTIGNSVTSIGNWAFLNCSGLTSVTIPNSVTSIGNEAFYGCSGLTSVTIPNSVISIGLDAFNGCTSLSDLTIDCKTVDRLFSEVNTSIRNLTIGNSVTSIGYEAFRNCTSLTFVSIGKSVTSIDITSFPTSDMDLTIDCPRIGKWFLQKPIKNLIIGNSVKYIEEMAFSDCPLSSVVIGNSVKVIGDNAFQFCSVLTSVTIPNSVTSIGDGAFWGCSGLTSVYSNLKNPCNISEDCFDDDVYNNATLYVPKGTNDKYKSTDYWSKFIHIEGGDPLESNEFTLTFLVDGETYLTYSLEEGDVITPEKAPTKEGYTFSGWSEIPTTMPASDLTITGTFVPNKYKLTYMVDGVEYKSSEIEFGSTIAAEEKPAKEGYTFSGWSEIPSTMPASDVTITGTFTINKYKLTYTLDGKEYKTAEVDYGTALTAEEAPVKEGYTFSGWSEIPETMPANDVTVTGTFTVNKYKLTYMVDGEEYKSSEVDYGTAITAEAVPTKEGYTFSGWSEIPSTMPAEDVTVTGTFTVNKYTITYMVDDVVLMTEEVDYGSTIAPPRSQKDGYDILWSSHPTTMPAYDITIYGTYTTGINGLNVEEKDRQVFTPDGKRVDTPKKGLNIIRMSDGTVKKVVVK